MIIGIIVYLIIGIIYAIYSWRKYLNNPNRGYDNKISIIVDWVFSPCTLLVFLLAILYTLIIGLFD